jgi:hypothetical protein
MQRRSVLRWCALLAGGLAGCSQRTDGNESPDGGLEVIETVWSRDATRLVVEAWVANTGARLRTGTVQATVEFSDETTLTADQRITVETMESPTPKATFFLEVPDETSDTAEVAAVTVDVVDQWITSKEAESSTTGDGSTESETETGV